jgi:hypothetical protein
MDFKLLTILNLSIVHQTGSAANLGHSPSTFIEEAKDPEKPIQKHDSATSLIEHQQDDNNDTDQTTNNDTSLGPTPPTLQRTFSFLSTTCSMFAAMMPLKKNSKTLSAIALTSNF